WLAMTRDGSGVLATPMGQMPALAHALASEPAAAVRSFDEVYTAHVGFVWRVLRTLGVAEAQIEDAVQDVFGVVHRRLPEWEGEAGARTGRCAMAGGVASTHGRRGGGDRTEPLADEPAGGADTFADMSRAQAAATVLAILEQLDEDKRIVFALVELEQLT